MFKPTHPLHYEFIKKHNLQPQDEYQMPAIWLENQRIIDTGGTLDEEEYHDHLRTRAYKTGERVYDVPDELRFELQRRVIGFLFDMKSGNRERANERREWLLANGYSKSTVDAVEFVDRETYLRNEIAFAEAEHAKYNNSFGAGWYEGEWNDTARKLRRELKVLLTS